MDKSTDTYVERLRKQRKLERENPGQWKIHILEHTKPVEGCCWCIYFEDWSDV